MVAAVMDRVALAFEHASESFSIGAPDSPRDQCVGAEPVLDARRKA